MFNTHHILESLEIPARYEKLEAKLGSDVSRALVSPDNSIESLRMLAISSLRTREGLLIPVCGPTGTGKTTLIENISFFLPDLYEKTNSYQGIITFDELNKTVASSSDKRKIIPINIDHREGSLPTDEELAIIKRFLRSQRIVCIIFWLETSKEKAENIEKRYSEITGKPPIELPLMINGPDRKAWRDILINTIQLCNKIPYDQIEEIGININVIPIESQSTLGEYIKAVANEFSRVVYDQITTTRKQITLIIVFASESLTRGSIPSFTLGGDPGLLNSHALLSCTPDSMVGQKWDKQRGILTQTILRLNARAFWLPPASIISVLTRYGPDEVKKIIHKYRKETPKPSDVSTYIQRTDIGKYFMNLKGATYEIRGKPAEEAQSILMDIASKYGYSRGKDKVLNKAFLKGFMDMFNDLGVEVKHEKAESGLDFCTSIIPDNQFEIDNHMICIEYVWRTGDILSSNRRSEAAQYILEKLNNYAVNFGWKEP